MKCIIPCAGKGTRIGSIIPKSLIKINDHTILGHITWQWSDVIDEYVIVVNPENEAQIRQNSGKAKFVVQEEPKGLADAILQAEPHVNGKFIVHLGDCLFKGKFQVHRFSLGIGVWKTDDLVEINKSYLVEEDGLIRRVTEKPSIHPADMHDPLNCGMGVYFLDERVFDYIRRYKGKPGGGDFTDVLQSMITAEEKITPIWFKGKYINITYPEDIKKAEEILKCGK